MVQTLFFFGAIMVVTFFAGVLFTTSQGNHFWSTYHEWVDKEVTTQKYSFAWRHRLFTYCFGTES